jgi:hypothetical protein
LLAADAEPVDLGVVDGVVVVVEGVYPEGVLRVEPGSSPVWSHFLRDGPG